MRATVSTARSAACLASTTAAAWRSASRERRLGAAIAIFPLVIVMVGAVGAFRATSRLLACLAQTFLSFSANLFSIAALAFQSRAS